MRAPRSAVLAALVLSAWTFASPQPAAQPAKPAAKGAPAAKKVTLVVTGDNRGEVAPCG